MRCKFQPSREGIAAYNCCSNWCWCHLLFVVLFGLTLLSLSKREGRYLTIISTSSYHISFNSPRHFGLALSSLSLLLRQPADRNDEERDDASPSYPSPKERDDTSQ